MSSADMKLLTKIRRVQLTLDKTGRADTTEIVPEVLSSEAGYKVSFDVNEGISEDDLVFLASGLVAGIASLKDHLKAWCERTGVPFTGEQFLDSNRDASIIHDLWNIDKHEVLKSKPRSGCLPKIVGIRRTMRVMLSENSNAAGVFFGPSGVQSMGAYLTIGADIVDETGKRLDDFMTVCERAFEAWAHEIERTSGMRVALQA